MSTLKATNLQNASSSTVNIVLDSSANATINGNGVIEGNLQFDSGFGSAATAYGVRAWINFQGNVNPPSIRGSGNVSSLTDHGTGDFTMNFSTSMPDSNYCPIHGNESGFDVQRYNAANGYGTTGHRVVGGYQSGNGTLVQADIAYNLIAIVR